MLSLAIAALPFAFVTSIAPGPNTIMVTASVANFGYRRTIPHRLGVTFGYPAMLILVGAAALAAFRGGGPERDARA